MKLSRTTSAIIGVLTGLPLVYAFTFVTYLIPRLFFLGSSGERANPSYFELFRLTFALHGAMILLTLGLLTFYVVFVYRAEAVPVSRKPLWTIVLVLGSIIAMPVFWYLYLWRRQSSPYDRRQEASP